ncbi:MAG TPA: aspartate--ammonia ligase [Oscillospiraceae bacterium]|nr:aspartate--ammonia ligase [Oscillospiraceae bacterium]HNW03785.1 aspartate--ammonia ligase [Oscillospiraceae bacterium]HPW00045.1 aspartate--ammonia ligase [Oscillospiraceae bacterium]
MEQNPKSESFGELGIIETETAIKFIKDSFQTELAHALGLTRVSAPLFVFPESGLNDNLSGVEMPVRFKVKSVGKDAEVVQSLAKWKRLALKRYGFGEGSGLYTDMNAIRPDEDLDDLHSIYVDQWDWEMVITREQRNLGFLEDSVRKIYGALRGTQQSLCGRFPGFQQWLPEEITFLSTQELEDRMPDLTPKEREDRISEQYGAVFLMQIGAPLKSGAPHDSRAPDYDDWSLNGDILIWYPVLGRAVELSSMGIRVDPQSLDAQLEVSGCEDRKTLPFHKALLAGELPLTMGGGIGQSRICMVLLGKRHIGEVQASVWSDEMLDFFFTEGISIL